MNPQHDEVTGLHTGRAALLQVLAAMIERARDENQSTAVIYGDVDGLQRFNDSHYKGSIGGHDIGDAWLREAGHAIEAELGATGRAWRFGGDEFVILMPHASMESALDVAERIRVAVSRVRVERQADALSMTLAVALLPQHGADAADLLSAAEEALWKGKDAGRDRVYVALGVG